MEKSIFFDYFAPSENKRIPFHQFSNEQKEDIRFNIQVIGLQELSPIYSFSIKINNLDGKYPDSNEIFNSQLRFIKHSVHYEVLECQNESEDNQKEYSDDNVISLMFKKPNESFAQYQNRIEFFNKFSDRLKEEIQMFTS